MPTPRQSRPPATWVTFVVAAFVAGVVCGGVWMRSAPRTAAAPTLAAKPSESLSQRVPSLKPLGDARDQLRAVLSTRDGASREDELRGLARSLASRDAAAAWILRSQITGLADLEEFCLEVMRVWSESDPQAAWDAAVALPAGRLRSACAVAALEGWARVAPEEALALASRALTGVAREEAIAGVVRTWAAGAAPAAAAWAAENVSAPGATGALRAALHAWADHSPAAASQWVAGLPPGDTFDTAAEALVATWGRQAPVDAAAWLSASGPDRSIDGPAAALAAEWAGSDPAAATAWAATLARTLTAREAATRALGEWAAVAPGEAATWLAGKAPQIPEISPALHDSLGASWAAHDPAAAAAWLNSLRDPYTRADAATPVFNTWAATDAVGLSDWISRNPQSPVADEARAQLALTRAESAPAEAISVALQVSAHEEAADLGRRILDDWRARDLVAADYWMVANPQAAEFIEPLD